MCDYAEVCNTVDRRARKRHTCRECGKKIDPGTIYKYTSGIFDGSPFSHKWCVDCYEIYYFVASLPETECIDSELYEYLSESDYIPYTPHDEDLEHGPYCVISADVPWLTRIDGHWKLTKTRYTDAIVKARQKVGDREWRFLPI